MFFIAGTSSRSLATSFGKHFNKDVFFSDPTYFKNGELKVCVPESVLGKKVVLVQSIAYPPHRAFARNLKMK